VRSLHVDDVGTGEPVVLLHSHGLSGGQWRKLGADLVARGRRVLAVDLTGQGRSEPWPEPAPFSSAIDVERVGDLVRAVAPAHVVGHSYGGLIALHVARDAPDRVRTLSLYDPVAFGVLDADEDRDARAVLDALDLTWEPAQRERWLRTFVEFWSGAGAWRALRDDAKDEFSRVAWVIREGVRSLMADRTPLAAYARVGVPALLATGERSPLPARRVVERLAQAMPYARHEVVAGVGHLGPVTHARDVNPHILAEITAPRL
jgi:pimeloyl-ACP methyl ester carboxylesterase